MEQRTSNDMLFTEDLAGPDGVAIILFPDERHTEVDLDMAKKELRDQRDVVSMRVANESDWDYYYKGQIFRDKRTRNLKWYEIEQDEKVIRRERKKGTSPEDFVTRFVLPFAEQSHSKMLGKYGKSIYEI